MADEIRSRFVLAGGVRTHYSESGDAEPVILALHGGGHGSSGRAGMGLAMTGLAPNFRVVAPDSIGGFGLTDTSVRSPYGLQSRLDHIADVADTLCLDRFTILGNSQGAWCAAKYAMQHPDRVERIVIIATNTIARAMGLKASPTPAAKAFEDYDGTREAMRALLKSFVHNSDRITDALIDERQAAALRPGAREAFADQAAGTKFLQNDPAMSVNFDMREHLPRVTNAIPTIMIWGEDDVFAPPELGRQLERLLPGAKLHWVPNAGHQVQTDQPDAVVKIITEFCAKDAR
jgi:pimeloyl-ACP methyl ester carboxylesterase